MSLPPCPHCGGPEIEVKGRADGPVSHYYDEDGDYREANYDEVFFRPHGERGTPRCIQCQKVRNDLMLDQGVIVERRSQL